MPLAPGLLFGPDRVDLLPELLGDDRLRELDLDINATSSGEVRRVDLVNTTTDPVLGARLVDPEGRPTCSVALFEAVGPEGRLVRRVIRAMDGVFLIEGLPCGEHRLTVRPDVTEVFGATFLQTVREVVVAPSTGTRIVSLVTKRGGRLRILVRDAKDGAFLPAECHIIAEDGAPVEAWFLRRLPSSTKEGRGELLAGAPNELREALSPGEYRVQISLAGYRTAVEKVDVVAGRMTEVIVALDRR